jgi:hypothetical protein
VSAGVKAQFESESALADAAFVEERGFSRRSDGGRARL